MRRSSLTTSTDTWQANRSTSFCDRQIRRLRAAHMRRLLVSYRCQLIAHFLLARRYVLSAMAGRRMRAPAVPAVCPWQGSPVGGFSGVCRQNAVRTAPIGIVWGADRFRLNGICPVNTHAMCRFPFQMRKFYPFLFLHGFDDNLFYSTCGFCKKNDEFWVNQGKAEICGGISCDKYMTLSSIEKSAHAPLLFVDFCPTLQGGNVK